MKKKRDVAKVEKLVAEIKALLLMAHWTVTITCREKEPETEEGSVVEATSAVLSNYYSMEIVLYPAFWKCVDRREVIIHEMLHALTDRSKRLSYKLHDGELVTSDDIHDTDERLVSHLTSIIKCLEKSR